MKTLANLKLRKLQQGEMAGEAGETEVGHDKEEQTSLILIEELQVEMMNLRAQVHNLTDAMAADNPDDRKASLALNLSDSIHQESPQLCTDPLFIPGGGDEYDTNATTSPSATRKRYHSFTHRSMIRTVNVLNRMSVTQQVVDDDDSGFIGLSLDDDTFTLMTITRFGSKSWTLGSCSFLFQMTLASQILIEQIKLSDNSSTFNVPFKVTISVRLAQLLSIALSLAMQSEILTSVRAFLVLGRVNSNWVSVIGRQGERKSLVVWLIYVAFPNMLKFVQGFIVLTTCLVVIVQADDIIVLLKDFTALMVVSEIDNVLFELAAYGYLGEELRQETERIKDITVIPNVNSNASKREILDYRLRESAYIRGIFLLVLSALLAVWITVVVRQENGTYFKDKYPNCGIENFELAKKYFGDRDCYGGALNTLACKFEDGDCVEFNIAYPTCKGFDNLTNVESNVGNGECNEEFAISECAYDGGDCCPLSIIRDPLFGDGQCNGGKMGTEKCGYDDGDCNNFIIEYPNCSLESLSENDSSDGVVFGNGICESSIYASDQCGYESKDCGIGQIGQDIILFGVSSGSSLYFSTVISKDGSKLAVGMPRSTKEGKDSFQSPGIVRIYQYDITKKRWLLEDELFGSQDGEWFGFDLHMSSDAKQVVIGSPYKRKNDSNNVGEVNIFRFNEMNAWVKMVSAPLPSNDLGGFKGTSISTSDNGSRLAISIPFTNKNGGMLEGAIQVFDFDSKTEMWDQVGRDIYGKEQTNIIGQFYQHLNSEDGSRIFFSSGYVNSPQDVHLIVYEFNEETQDWEQVGVDIPNPFPTRNPPAISANGHRFAISSYATDSSSPGQVQIFELEEDDFYGKKEWKQLGSTLKESIPSNGDGFGTSLSMSADGDFLAISTVGITCNGVPQFCPTGHINLFRYRPNVVQGRTFVQVPLKPSAAYGNVAAGAERFRDHNVVGTAVSLSADGSKIFINGFDSNKNYGFVKAYMVKELFYDECIVPNTEEIGNGNCYGIDPYISLDCGYDGEDCGIPQTLPGLPDCLLSNPSFLGDGACNEFLPFNSKECNFDGGDCTEPTAVEGYLNCFVSNPEWIGNGRCDQGLPYNSFDCGFDGGDCSPP